MRVGFSAGVNRARRRMAMAVVLLAPLTWALTAGPAKASPTANNQTVSTHMNHALDITLTGANLGGPSWNIQSGPSHGSLARNGAPDNSSNPNLIYTPDADFS